MPYQSMLRPGAFEARNIIVTGGGSGIGRCTAHELASLGATVWLVGRKEEKLKQVAGEIAQDGGAARYRVCDIRDENAVREMVASVYAEAKVVHGLVNNAGGQFPAPLSLISQKGFETVVRTNLVGGFLVAREVFVQGMNENGGSIVNITADFHNGMPMMGHSGAARAGMENFTKTAALEWAQCGVRVNAVAPGWIMTSGLDTYDPSMQQTILGLRHAIPLQRLGREAEVSSVICFLLSDAAAFVSGVNVRIDGAASLANAMFKMEPHTKSKPYQPFHREIVPKVLSEKP
ncbi:MAG: SDR family oxidoreductase [Myxococcaceae bacterium]|nr:SDR family oxidoreductase [Myxococcaceae bacterium]